MDRRKLLKISMTVIVLGVFCAALFYLYPVFRTLGTEQGRRDFSENILALGPSGPLVIIVLAICKTFLMFLPGEPLELLSGMCFGTLMGTVWMLIGYVSASLTIAYLSKRYGRAFIDSFVSEEKFRKVRTFIEERPRSVEAVIALMYLLPFIPKDVIPYSVGILKISLKRFLVISVTARLPAIVSSAFVGSRILSGDYQAIALVYVITYSFSAAIYFLYYLTNRKKTSGE